MSSIPPPERKTQERVIELFPQEQVLYALRQATDQQEKTVYEANQATYALLRYGVQVKGE